MKSVSSCLCAVQSFSSCIRTLTSMLIKVNLWQVKHLYLYRYYSPAATKGLEWGALQGRQKWSPRYSYHCRPSLAMIVDLFVVPGLCFQSLSTFYFRFHCRPLNNFGKNQCHIKPGNSGGLRCEYPSVKVGNSKQHFDFRPSSRQCSKNTVGPKLLCFHIRIHPCLIF